MNGTVLSRQSENNLAKWVSTKMKKLLLIEYSKNLYISQIRALNFQGQAAVLIS